MKSMSLILASNVQPNTEFKKYLQQLQKIKYLGIILTKYVQDIYIWKTTKC